MKAPRNMFLNRGFLNPKHSFESFKWSPRYRHPGDQEVNISVKKTKIKKTKDEGTAKHGPNYRFSKTKTFI